MKARLQPWGDTKVISIASCFIFDQDGRLLLLRRHSEDLGGGQWGTAGGRLELGEAPKAAMVREVREETGLDASSATLLGSHIIKMPHGGVHMSSFSLLIPSNIPIVLQKEEHEDFRWFNVERLLDEDNILWGIPSILRDFDLFHDFETDPTLADGSEVKLQEKV
jgi:8-oxo-dGTP diphosphatase